MVLFIDMRHYDHDAGENLRLWDSGYTVGGYVEPTCNGICNG